MPRGRPEPNLCVVGTNHFIDRWVERVGRPTKRLNRMLTATLREQIGKGLQTDSGGFPLLELDAEKLGLTETLVVPLVPKLNGVWVALTIRPNKEGEYHAEPLPDIEIR